MNVSRFLWQLITWHFPPDDYVRWGWWMLSMPLLLFIVLRAPFYIARQWDGCGQRALRAAFLFFAVLFGADVAYYAQAAYLRANVPARECHVKGPSPYGPYDALVCVTAGLSQNAGAEGFVRLRSTVDGTVLAEKEFYNPSPNEVFWGPDDLIVGVGDGMAVIQIPPRWLDRLRAKLP
jgi:hypothetical protein